VNEPTVRVAGEGRIPLKIWIAAARPRTLPAAISPVLVGTALAIADGVFRPLAFIAALVGSVFIQIGTNLANDYSDARRGADTADRLGPVRVTAGGLVAPRQVLIATWAAFGIAVLFGIYLIALVGWELLLVGVASIAAGVLYTGGPRPYGYEGLGELFVFGFFGIVAVVGSYYVQTEELDGLAFALAVPVGLLAAAILMVNNIRDIDTDSRVGKRTLAVRLKRDRARLVFTATLWGAFGWTLGLAIGEEPWLFPAAATIALLGPSLSSTVATRTDGPSLNGALAGTARLLAIYSLALSAGVLLGY
jgi:1,4-dihydroxy-2-naphthoate polyprenyltransferase